MQVRLSNIRLFEQSNIRKSPYSNPNRFQHASSILLIHSNSFTDLEFSTFGYSRPIYYRIYNGSLSKVNWILDQFYFRIYNGSLRKVNWNGHISTDNIVSEPSSNILNRLCVSTINFARDRMWVLLLCLAQSHTAMAKPTTFVNIPEQRTLPFHLNHSTSNAYTVIFNLPHPNVNVWSSRVNVFRAYSTYERARIESEQREWSATCILSLSILAISVSNSSEIGNPQLSARHRSSINCKIPWTDHISLR